MKNDAHKIRAQYVDYILAKAEADLHGEIDVNAIDDWHEDLSPYDLKSITLAFEIHRRRDKYFPAICQIIEILDKGRYSIEARAQEQWRTVMAAVRQHGLNRPPLFADPITADLVGRQFTWRYLCSIEADQIKWEFKRWCEAFELAAEMPYQAPALEAPPRHVSALLAPIGRIEQKGTP